MQDRELSFLKQLQLLGFSIKISGEQCELISEKYKDLEFIWVLDQALNLSFKAQLYSFLQNDIESTETEILQELYNNLFLK